MTSTLIPEKPLVISPTLATTIGLEDAAMLTILGDVAQAQGNLATLKLNHEDIMRLMPFWQEHDIQRISNNLRNNGIIELLSAPFTQSHQLHVRFASGVLNTSPSASPSHSATPSIQPQVNRGANIIAANWQPDRELMAQIAQYNIPDYFIRQQLPEFIAYWRGSGKVHHAWGAKFLKHTIRKWRENETELFQRDQEIAMHAQWRPSPDALDILIQHAAINSAFVEDAIPEFVLYWAERGDVGRIWNSKFIQHVKRQWAYFTHAMKHDTQPQRMTENWQPSNDVFDILRLANIDTGFAKQQISEFVLFWRDSNKLQPSWNTKFLQHIKYLWAQQHSLISSSQAKHHEGQQLSRKPRSTRDRSLIEDLTDRSWAS